jgi:hypothetical protein
MFHFRISCDVHILGKVSGNFALAFQETYGVTRLEAMIFLDWIYLIFEEINESMVPWALREEGILNKNYHEKD